MEASILLSKLFASTPFFHNFMVVTEPPDSARSGTLCAYQNNARSDYSAVLNLDIKMEKTKVIMEITALVSI